MDYEFLRAYTTYIEMMEPMVKEGASPCVKQMFQQDYWVAGKVLDEQNTKIGLYLLFVISIIVVLLLGIIALVFCLRKKYTPEDEEVAELASDASEIRTWEFDVF